ncbi:hypothetical protein [Aurantiacibacter sp. D1-12]|uniref:hypothetical protein n=1 Tax=Aurantiacibacter sp. D1-12 TaxID=2993658 RepID=UPI00237CF763|nr:hypothetical protein [Aurantiacibacter sp. D1-12]MDE1468009.1 hypothetical protein [Aurantiacibacter sp. D1-12]
MTLKTSKFASAAAMAAALSLGATPAAAVELPGIGSGPAIAHNGEAAEQNHHHRWRRHHRHRNRVDAGDVVAGVLVLGTIAAIAGVFDGDNDRRERRRDDRDYRERDNRNYEDRRDRYDSNGVERAADMCVEQIERGQDRVSDVTQAARRSDGWHVAGTLEGGSGWTCWIDNEGRIRSVDFGAVGYPGEYDASTPSSGGDQWSDQDYARARATTVTPGQGSYSYRSAEAPQAEGPQPDYPGGPLPGEEGYGEVDADLR